MGSGTYFRTFGAFVLTERVVAFTRKVGVSLLCCCLPLFCQSNTGELRLRVTDPAGLAVKTSIEITSEANQYRRILSTDEQGELTLQRLPYGVYQVEVRQAGFAEISEDINVRSSIPSEHVIQLKVSAPKESVTVSAANTLIDPDQAGSVNEIGSESIQNRVSSVPGRSIQDLVNSQPGWLYEGNAVLHPRDSEYQTQFVVDGIPLTDNRSPSFGPEIEADDVQSISIYTAGIPAEYGRKMGGVVEVNTLEDSQPGFHGQVVLSGGSFDSAGAFARGQYAWGRNLLGASASGSMTDHYLNPVVVENYTNRGTLGDFSTNYQRDLTQKDRIDLIVRHDLSRYELPNEEVQQAAGQLQTADNIETMGIVSYQHTFSSTMLADLRGMVRDNADDFYSNANSTPLEILQHNRFREGYFKGSLTMNHGRHEIKAGVESDNLFLHEDFNYKITDGTAFDPGTPPIFSFAAQRPDLEQAVYVQDLIRMGNWTVNAGLRWDHYQLLVNREELQPRLAISRYFPSANLIVHFSYDRVFQTPSFENLLLSSSTAVTALNPVSVQLPVKPSEGNYYEAGLTKVFFDKVKLDANSFRRAVSNFADDDQIENTTISFPIAFRKAIVYGAEGKLELPEWKKLSGFVSYSYEVGNAWNPVTGGLFLGADAQIPTTGYFPISQDQRNTVRGRLSYQMTPRLWIAGGVQFDSGLPFEFQCDPSLTLEQCVAGQVQTYGEQVVDRVNFAAGRIYPTFQVSASAGADVYKSERLKMSFQIDGQNLTNVVNVIDFGGLFSGNAIGPSRSVMMRLSTNF
ncbi:MAG TPA: TonB-dependent receptor [Candidatus Acidoferrales bacterium]|nr:TonB-dependent receptor [Candidatus Acidoferrales bacterium]